MGLEQYIANFITFVNNIVIPFLLGIAFLFFVINVFRYFIVGGSSEDGREKAKLTATYSVAAFVLIMLFWGIVSLLTQSLGLGYLAQTTPRCFDYQCGQTPAQQTNGGSNVGGGFGFGTGSADPFDPIVNGGGSDQSPGFTGGIITTNPPLQPSPDGYEVFAPTLDSVSPNIDTTSTENERAAVIKDAITPVTRTLENFIPEVTDTLFNEEIDFISSAELDDETRMRMFKSYNSAGIVSDGEFFATADNLNDAYTLYNGERVNLTVPDMSFYTQQLLTYGNAIKNDINQSNLYAQEIGLSDQSQLAVTANDLYSTNNTLESNIDKAYEKYQLLTGTQTGVTDREEFLNNFIAATNIYIARTGENSGTPITREDILGE